MTAEQIVAALHAAGVAVNVTAAGDIYAKPTPRADLLADLKRDKAAILALLRTRTRETPQHVCRPDPDFAEVAPNGEAELAALADGWTQRPDGRWQFPASWSALDPRLPYGHGVIWEGFDEKPDGNCIALPADAESLPDLQPLTENEKRAIRTHGVSLPAGVGYGQTTAGTWRRLS